MKTLDIFNSYQLLKRTKILIFFVFLVVKSTLYAQDFKVDQTLPAHKWEMGANIVPFLGPERDFDFIVKRAIGNNKAIRLRATPRYNNSKNDDYPIFDGVRFANGSFSLGLEKRQTHGKFMFYYGGDFNFIYKIQSALIGIGISGPGVNPQPVLNKDYSKEFGGGLSGIVGGKYFINHHISLSIESTLSANYKWSRSENGTIFYDGQPARLFVNETLGTQISFVGLSAFFLSYHF